MMEIPLFLWFVTDDLAISITIPTEALIIPPHEAAAFD